MFPNQLHQKRCQDDVQILSCVFDWIYCMGNLKVKKMHYLKTLCAEASHLFYNCNNILPLCADSVVESQQDGFFQNWNAFSS